LGGSGNDFMHGGPDNDTMMGGTGRDTIIGGFGDDVLTGDNGPDLFVFNPDVGTGNDTITDFEDGFDTILIAGSTEFSDLSIDEIDGNTVVTWEGGSVTLTDVTGVIDENDFTFS
ncbi:MAG: type I secretion protein, partial [Roseovarius indicus]